MKKLSAFFLLCLITLTLTACGKPADAAPDSISTDKTGSAEAPQIGSVGSAAGSSEENADPNTRSFRDCTVSVVGYSLRKDENNDTALCVEYEFKNNSRSAASFSTTVIPNAYQAEENESLSDADVLEYATPKQADDLYSAMLTRIQPGESITCAAYYKLNSETLPVTLQVRDLRDSTAKALTRELDITGLTVESASSTNTTGSAAS